MTEAEWLNGGTPFLLLNYIRGTASDRKRRLLDCACGRYLEPWWPDALLGRALDRAERHADGLLADATLAQWRRRLSRMEDAAYQAGTPADWLVCHTVRGVCYPLKDRPGRFSGCCWLGLEEPGAMFGPQAAVCSPGWVQKTKRMHHTVIVDLFGNPFRPIAFDPRWRTADVVGLATGIYEDRAFDRLPLLSDALRDAGCDDEQLLGHCRSEGPHVKGCHVVDLVLGRE